MINFNKKHLYIMTMIITIFSALTLAGCTSSNMLIVPDGSKRVPINRDTTINGANIHQGLISKHDEAA